MLLDDPVGGHGEVDDGVERGTDRVGTGRPQGGPELQGVEPAGGLQRLVDLVRLGGVLGVQVVGVPGGAAQVLRALHEQGARRHRLEERLVQVGGHAPGPFDAVEQVPAGRGHEQPAAVRGVDVQPDSLEITDVRDRLERVDHPAVGGAGGGDDGHRRLPGCAGGGDRLGEGGGHHPAGVVGGDGDHGLEPEQPRRLRDAEVGLRGREHGAAGAQGLARQQQGLQVRLRAARGEDAVTRGEPDPTGEPGDDVPLDLGADPGLVPGVDRRVHGGQDRLGGDRGQRDRAVQVREVRRVVEPDGLTDEQLVEFGERAVRPEGFGVEVDVLHPGPEDLGSGVGRRTVGGGEAVGQTVHRGRHGGAVALGGGGGQEFDGRCHVR